MFCVLVVGGRLGTVAHYCLALLLENGLPKYPTRFLPVCPSVLTAPLLTPPQALTKGKGTGVKDLTANLRSSRGRVAPEIRQSAIPQNQVPIGGVPFCP